MQAESRPAGELAAEFAILDLHRIDLAHGTPCELRPSYAIVWLDDKVRRCLAADLAPLDVHHICAWSIAMHEQEVARDLKRHDADKLQTILRESCDDRTLLTILKGLGSLPRNFDGSVLVRFLDHPNDDIRLLAAKNLAKVANPRFLTEINGVAKRDDNSMVRREAVSAIGRLRNSKAIPYLVSFLDDPDPKVVLQAIRGLLVFRRSTSVRNSLVPLASHPNEMIQTVIRRELFSNNNSRTQRMPHATFPKHLGDTVVHGDVRQVLHFVPDESIHLTFTSPPYYNARDYSIYTSYEEYLQFLTNVFGEVHRVTKEGRFLAVNTSPIIIPRVSRAYASKRYPIPFDLHARLVSLGWEFIDDIVWVKPESSVKNRNAGFLQHRKPLAYKPNAVSEYIMVYRKETDHLLDWNMRQYDAERVNRSKVRGEYDTTNVWNIDPVFDKVHSAVFPLELCDRIIKYYSYVGDLVFDPFAGSGTLGRSARSLGRSFCLVEIVERYIQRIRENLAQRDLFERGPTRFLSLDEFRSIMSGKEHADDDSRRSY